MPKPPENERAALRRKLIDDYTEKTATPYLSAGLMVNDEIIRPSETRKILIATLDALSNKKVRATTRNTATCPSKKIEVHNEHLPHKKYRTATSRLYGIFVLRGTILAFS